MNRFRCSFGLLVTAMAASLASAQDVKVVPQPPVPQPPVPQAAVGATAPNPGMPTPQQLAGGNAWFPATNQDLGTFFGQGEAVGTFKFKNPTDQTIEWKNLTGSCQCLRAQFRIGDRNYDLSSKPTPNQLTRVTKGPKGAESERVLQITIAPHEEGEVEVHLDMAGITGPKQATLDIHSTDPALPQLRLHWNAMGAQLFSVSPAEINLNKMTWNETREFTVAVTSPMHKDWNITRMDDAGKSFDVSWTKATNNDVTTWTINGKYGPVDGDSAGGGVLKFYADVRGESSFLVRVMAFVQGPLEVKPGAFLTFGMVRKGDGLTKQVIFEPNDGTQLEATGFRFEKMTIGEEFVTATQHKDGEKLVVDINVSANAPAGLLKGDLVVVLNHPVVKEKRIMFNGFVR
ncbi:MAG: hypothetical protein ABIP94_13825 [Planctomycetota bacterium]